MHKGIALPQPDNVPNNNENRKIVKFLERMVKTVVFVVAIFNSRDDNMVERKASLQYLEHNGKMVQNDCKVHSYECVLPTGSFTCKYLHTKGYPRGLVLIPRH